MSTTVQPAPIEQDHLVLSACAGWHQAAARAMVIWADYDRATMFGSLDDSEVAPTPTKRFIESLRTCECILSSNRPTTATGAREMLHIGLQILAHRQIEPNATLAAGPVFEIVRNVWLALSHADDIALRPIEEG